MKLRITQGTLSSQHGRDGQDIGLTMLFAGEYTGSLCDSGDLEINIGNGHLAYVPSNKIEEKIERGDLVVLAL